MPDLANSPPPSTATRASAVLVVDDDPAIREMCQAVLETEGYQVMLAADGQQALRHLRASPVTLVLMDLMMPVMDGLEACRAIRADAQLQHIPVVIMSAAGSGRIEKQGLTECATAMVTKPFSIETLLQVLAEAAA